jgi:hypothetical protein
MAKRRPARQKAYRVFLSHSSQDTWISTVMKEKIEERGIRVWLDVFDLPGGAPLKARIREEVRASDECLILLSPASCASNWVRHEAGLADAFQKWTTLVLLHVKQDDVPETLRDLKFLSINDFADYLAQLALRAGKTS